nr:V-type ATPase subunit [Anaerolineae bacterium]
MSSITAYAAIQARVRAMYSTLLSSQAWPDLVETANFNLLIESIKQTAYGPYLTRVDDNLLTPRRAVFQLKQRLSDIYFTVVRQAPENTRPLFTQLYRHFEVNNLKAVLRGIAAGTSWEQVLYVLFPLDSETVLPAQRMLEAGSMEAAVNLLRGTPYYGTVSHSMERYTAEQSLFPLELALDLNYWRSLWHDVN